ncbi:SprT-like family-domain-containing protein, partial [Hysterangium stoloniferum]
RKRKITADQQRLEDYAKALFSELNGTVFGGRIPPETELIWNVRLLSTAGKAFFSRNRQDQTYTKIELAPKLLDCDERVRLTLAHEMCHLAVWVIDNNPSEVGHGPQFKAWASQVTQARPDITISTKHSYTINYTHRWECIECGKVYGRFSNSIDIETHGGYIIILSH